MNKIIYITVLILSVFGKSQTADEVVRKHFEVTGGIQNWNSLNSIKISGEVAIGVGDIVPIVIEHKRPYFKRVSYLIDDKEMLNEGFDGKQAFTYDEATGGYKKLVGYKPDAFETDLLNYDKKGFKIEFLGKDKVNSKDAYKIKLIKNSIEDLYWFDVNTYQIIKEKNDIEEVYYADFRKFGKLTFATKMEFHPNGGKEYVVIFNKIQPNYAIDESRFKFD